MSYFSEENLKGNDGLFSKGLGSQHVFATKQGLAKDFVYSLVSSGCHQDVSNQQRTLQREIGPAIRFYVYPIGQALSTVGAVYVITRRYKNSGSGISHDVLYVGDTLNLSLTLLNHPKWDCLIRGSANCIGAHIDEDQNSRVAKREDLIQQYAPACNRVIFAGISHSETTSEHILRTRTATLA